MTPLLNDRITSSFRSRLIEAHLSLDVVSAQGKHQHTPPYYHLYLTPRCRQEQFVQQFLATYILTGFTWIREDSDELPILAISIVRHCTPPEETRRRLDDNMPVDFEPHIFVGHGSNDVEYA